MSHKNTSKKSPRRVVQLGGRGSGKSTSGQSYQQTIAKRRFDARVVRTNAAYTYQQRRLAKHRNVTPSDQIEILTLQVNDFEITWEFWPGDHAMLNDGVDAEGIDGVLRAQSVDLLVITKNPFSHDQDLAEYAFLELTWLIQQQTGFELRKAMLVAAELLWSLSFSELEALNADLCQISNDQFREASIIRSARAKFGLPFSECFTVEGCIDGDQVLDILRRTARTTSADTLEVLNLQAIVACRPRDTIVVGTHADLLKFLPGVGESEFLRCCQNSFPDLNEVRVGQVHPLASLDIMIRPDLDQPVWIVGPSDQSDSFLTSAIKLLDRSGQHNRPAPNRLSVGICVFACAVAAVPIAVFATALAILPLISVGVWALIQLTPDLNLRNIRFRRSLKHESTAPNLVAKTAARKATSATGEFNSTNRVTEHFASRNGAVPHA